MDLDVAIQQTLVYHRCLDPTNPEVRTQKDGSDDEKLPPRSSAAPVGSSSNLTPPPAANPSFLSLVKSAIPLFKRLLQKPKAWLALAGSQFPSTAKTIEWANSVWTVLPWQECDKSLGGNPVSLISLCLLLILC
jgi:hypothetical protein